MSRDQPPDDEPVLFDLPLKPGASAAPLRPAPVPGRTTARGSGAAEPRGAESRGAQRHDHQTPRAQPGTGSREDPSPAKPGPSLFELTAAGAREEIDRSSRGRAPLPEPAPLAYRVGAGLADLAILGAVVGVLAAGLWWMGVPPRTADLAPLFAFAVAFSLVYYPLPLAFWGRSPGMGLLGLVARSRDGRPLSFRQAALRWLGAVVTLLALGLPVLLGLLGLSLVDRISGSATWRNAAPGATPTRPSPGSPAP